MKDHSFFLPSLSASPRFANSRVLAVALVAFTFLVFIPRVAQAQVETVVHSFNPSGDGVGPVGGVIEDSQGNLYGTTSAGGSSNKGTVFQISSNGVETVLWNFTGGADGGQPYAGVVRDPQGNLYGTTLTGGTFGLGTVYEVTGQNAEKVLVSFDLANGGAPFGGLVRDGQGNLYGMTSGGGAHALGAAFKLAPGGQMLMYSFKGAPDGALPQGQLVVDSKGNFYGVTAAGGTGIASFCKAGCGTVFKITPSGTESVLYSFQGGADGGAPAGGSYLVLDPQGNLYGATTAGGTATTTCTDGCGVVFKVTPGSGESVLHAFQGGTSDGFFAYSGLLRDGQGNLYGTTPEGGAHGTGTLYRVTPSGSETILYNFPGGAGDGDLPFAGLTSDGKGGAYGTTLGGGRFSGGTVYHIAP
jgi:uncharacterized repeat protein (TIGR03803 family)